jgi:hypothetical protein
LVGAENTARDNQTGATDQPTDTPSQNALDQTHPATFQELTAYLGEFSEHTHKQPTTRDVQTVLDACAKRLSVAQLREFVAGRMAQAKALVVTGYGIFAVIARELAPLAADWKPAAPVKHKVSLAEFRQRFDALYESWKKTGSGDRTSRAACSKLLADALKQGANLEYIEAGIAAWTAFHAEVGWKFCKPTLADMLQNRTWDMLPPDPHGGEKKSSGEKAFDMVYELHRDRKKGGPYGS